ncbi:MAG: sugar phosphate isomerase/epimerase [Thermoproteota archaeon]|nr:sugar phosphate isomerase/epimerase [Nitrosopumilus sp.]MDQ3083878.1 sugar phosphate isomerase/epimerase [Thermoproteota archaeon]
MTFSYSITLSSFLNIQKNDIETLENLSQLGLTEVELYGEPDDIDWKYFKDVLNSFDANVIGITGIWGKSSPNGWKRRLLSNDKSFLKYAEDYVLKCIKLCNCFGGKRINLCLISDPIYSFDVTHRNVTENKKTKVLESCVPLLTRLLKNAKEENVSLMIEPLNRYSTPYCCTYSDVIPLIERCDDLELMLDTFHMNIEENSFEDTILNSQSSLTHMHFADNNRNMPGYGHIDFDTIIKTLKKVSYKGKISFEPTISDRNYFSAVKFGLEHVKKLDLKY